MLIHMTPQDISANWDLIKETIVESREDHTEQTLNNTLQLMLKGFLDVWIVSGYGITVTLITTDTITGIRRLNVYALKMAKSMTKRVLVDLVKDYIRLARVSDCKYVCAETDNRAMTDLAIRHRQKVTSCIQMEV